MSQDFQQLNTFLSRITWKGHPLIPEPESLPDAFLLYPLSQTPNRTLASNEFIALRPGQENKLLSHPLRELRQRMVAYQPLTFLEAEIWYYTVTSGPSTIMYCSAAA